MKHLLFTFILVLSFSFLSGQNFDFGKISKEELQEKFHPKDSAASAAILYRNENISFSYSQSNGFIQQKEIVMRVKIYNKEGLEWANNKVYLYKSSQGNDEKIRSIKGYTYNLEGGKIEKDKLKNDGIFTEEATDLYTISSLTMPNVKEGSVIEYSYIISSPFIQLDDVNVQFSIPVKKLDVAISTPQFYKYTTRLNPLAFYIPEYTTKKVYKTLNMTQRVEGSKYVGSGSSITKNEVAYYDNYLELSEENIPSLTAESFAGSINNYKAKLSLELEARLAKEGYVEESFSTSWEGVSKNIYDSDNFGGQLNQSSFFQNDLKSILQDVDDEFHKVFLIESLVKSKVKWNGSYGIYAQKGIRSAYKDGEGSAADINLLVVAMLRSQGLIANPVLVSTRSNGIPLFPTREGFNYVICLVQSEDKYLLIDATEPYSFNNVLPERVLNWKGRILKERGESSWIDLKPKKKSTESTMLNVQIDDDLNVTGKVRKNYTSNLALNYRKRYTNLNIEDHIKSLESNKGDLEISELTYENDKNLGESVKVSYDFELGDGMDEIGEKLYFDPLFFLATKENVFKLEKRIYPIDFVMPLEEKFLVNIMVPEGYEVESLPISEAVQFKDGDVKFNYIIEENGKYLQLKVQLDISNPLILPKDYQDFKAFYSKIVEKQAEQIVLTKV